MQTIRPAVAMTVDGYIAGPNGEASWIEVARPRLGGRRAQRNHYHRLLSDHETTRPPRK
jgi:hypothetical protein